MSVCSDDLIALAERLIIDGGEASSRASISRSYYALYHQAAISAACLSLPHINGVMTAHEQLISRYCAASKGLANIGRSIRKQKRLRAKADYDIGDHMGAADARLCVATTKKIVADLRRITSQVAV